MPVVCKHQVHAFSMALLQLAIHALEVIIGVCVLEVLLLVVAVIGVLKVLRAGMPCEPLPMQAMGHGARLLRFHTSSEGSSRSPSSDGSDRRISSSLCGAQCKG